MFDREAKTLEQAVQDVLCDAAGGVQQSFVDASEVVDRSLCIFACPSKRDELDRQGSSSVHFANREQ